MATSKQATSQSDDPLAEALDNLADGYAHATGVDSRAALAPVIGGIAASGIFEQLLQIALSLLGSCIPAGGGSYPAAQRLVASAKAPTFTDQARVGLLVRKRFVQEYGLGHFRRQNGAALRDAILHAGANSTPEAVLALHQHARDNGLI